VPTCNAAVNPILWTGLKPVFVDSKKDTFNIDPEDLERKITSKSRAILVQHTFGLPADVERIQEIAKRNNLILIEDCAHSLGAAYKGKKVGTFGKVAFFSFSRDKIVSSVYGGMASTDDNLLAQKIKSFQKKAGDPSSCWIFQQLIHPLLFNCVILPSYGFLNIGKGFLIFCQQLRVLSKAVHWKEKRGRKPSYFPKKMPNALAILALKQLKKLERFNDHRKKIAAVYYDLLKDSSWNLPYVPENREHVFLRFTLKSSKARETIKKAWASNILIGDWYTSPIVPDDTQLDKMGYQKGSCPNAEELSAMMLNLPTHINIKKEEAIKVVNFLKKQ
jgi:perosamine synthetase